MNTGEPIARKRRWAPLLELSPADVPGYVIVTCSYTPNSAGIGCLYRLCDELNRRGYPSFMSGGRETAPHLDAPLIEMDAARELCSQGYTAIYPETINGNPLAAKSVVRWVLNRPGLLGGEEVYDDAEHVFYYSEVFLPYIKNRIAGKLYMPTIDEEVFWCDNVGDSAARSLECYYIGKSQWRDGLIDPSRVFEITRETPVKRELGKLLRASRVLYCFDNSTILIYEALLCGCPVVVIPDGTQSKSDYEKLELGIDGIAWGLDELATTRMDLAKLRNRYERVKREFHTQLDALVALTQARPLSHQEADARLMRRAQANSAWPRRAVRAGRSALRSALTAGRTAERTLRRARKRWLQRLFSKRPVEQQTVDDSRFFYCEDADPSQRSLACFYLGKSRWREGLIDQNTVFEIDPNTSAEQLGKLLRASRVLHTFSREAAMAEKARRCGCQVEWLDAKRSTVRAAA